MLYDPGGSYPVPNGRGSIDTAYGRDVKPADYIGYQKLDGPNVQVYEFDTTPLQEMMIQKRIEFQGSDGPLFCARNVSNALNGIGPFRGLGSSFTPAGLGRSLSRLR
jgi:hypothetical protein